MTDRKDLAVRASRELADAHRTLHRLAVLFTAISEHASLAGDTDESVELAAIGAALAAAHSERAEDEADFFAEESSHG